MAHASELRLRIVLTRPAETKDEFDTIDENGIEQHVVVAYNAVHTLAMPSTPWLGGRADGIGPTHQAATLQELLQLLGKDLADEWQKALG